MFRELKKYISNELATVSGIPVHYQEAPGDAKFPYVVYELNAVSTETGLRYQLDLNIWDKNASSGPVDELAYKLYRELDRTQHMGDYFQFTAYGNIINDVKDEDKRIKRRQMTFEINLFMR